MDEWGYILSVMCVFVFLKAAPPPPPCWNGNHVVVAILDEWAGGLVFFTLSLSLSLCVTPLSFRGSLHLLDIADQKKTGSVQIWRSS